MHVYIFIHNRMSHVIHQDKSCHMCVCVHMIISHVCACARVCVCVCMSVCVWERKRPGILQIMTLPPFPQHTASKHCNTP